jgi:hypothetical protein
MNAPVPGWNPDPTGRHEYRYWDGAVWTDDVSDQGVTSVDPMVPPGPPAGAPPYGTPSGGYPAQGGYPGQVGYDSYGGQAGPAPAPAKRSGPSLGLIVGGAAVAVALIAGIAFAVVSGRDDEDEPDSSEGVVDLIAEGMEQEANGLITSEQAECAAQAMVDELGVDTVLEVSADGGDPFAALTTEQQAAALTAITSCIPVDVLAQIGMSQAGTGG